MKTTAVHASFLFLLGALFIGCATTDQYDIRPDDAADGIPTAVAWQADNAAALAASTTPAALSAFVANAAAADALLAQLKGAYATDPIVMTQIGGVSQFVLCPKCEKAPEFRKVWIAALERKIATTDDDYVRTFCQQQLWICQ